MAREVDDECGCISDNVLFFGCRGEKSDFFCADLWRELAQRQMVKLFTAFSRDQVHAFTHTHSTMTIYKDYTLLPVYCTHILQFVLVRYWTNLHDQPSLCSLYTYVLTVNLPPTSDEMKVVLYCHYLIWYQLLSHARELNTLYSLFVKMSVFWDKQFVYKAMHTFKGIASCLVTNKMDICIMIPHHNTPS